MKVFRENAEHPVFLCSPGHTFNTRPTRMYISVEELLGILTLFKSAWHDLLFGFYESFCDSSTNPISQAVGLCHHHGNTTALLWHRCMSLSDWLIWICCLSFGDWLKYLSCFTSNHWAADEAHHVCHFYRYTCFLGHFIKYTSAQGHSWQLY